MANSGLTAALLDWAKSHGGWLLGSHCRPHPDEAAACWALINGGEGLFPGISKKHRFVFFGEGGLPPRHPITGSRLTADQWEKERLILVGTGRGRFDEHDNLDRIGESATTLVVKQLGLENDQLLVTALGLNERAYQPGGRRVDLVPMMDMLHRHPDLTDEQVLSVALQVLDSEYWRIAYLADRAPCELAAAQIVDLRAEDGTPFSAVWGISSEPDFIWYCFSARAARQTDRDIRLVVRIDPKGLGDDPSIAIIGKNLFLNELAARIRATEMVIGGHSDLHPDALLDSASPEFRTVLHKKDRVWQAPEWYFYRSNILLNGGPTAPNVRPTHLTLEQLRELVRTSSYRMKTLEAVV